MIKIFDQPEYITVTQAEERFSPNSVLMIRCIIEDHAPIAGYVAAAETQEDDFNKLCDYEKLLMQDPQNGEVYWIATADSLDCKGLYITQDF